VNTHELDKELYEDALKRGEIPAPEAPRGRAMGEGLPPLEAYDLPEERPEPRREAAQARPEKDPESISDVGPFGAPAKISEWCNTEPPAIEEVFEGLLVRGVVGGLFAQGGTGKTYLLVSLLISAALGKQAFKSFRPTGPQRVLAFLGEDPPEMIHGRVRGILENFEDIDTELLTKNLRLYCGTGLPLMGLEGANPGPTVALEWLRKEVQTFRPDLIVIDPKSMFYGLDENNNDHNTQWIAALKSLTLSGASCLFSHHENKTLSGALELGGARGGSALVDGSRFAMSMRPMTEEDAARYGIEEAWKYVELKGTKNSYIAKLPGSLFFRITSGGGLEEVDLKATHEARLMDELTQALQEDARAGKFYTAREVYRSASILSTATKKDRKATVERAIEMGRLTLVTVPAEGRGRPREVLKVPDNGIMANMAQRAVTEIKI